MNHTYAPAERESKAAANISSKENGRAAAFQANSQRRRAIAQRRSIPSAATGQVTQLLQNEYTFTAAEFRRDMTNEQRGVYLFAFGEENVVVKYNVPAEEHGLTRLARQAGINASQIRPLTGTELTALTGIRQVRMRDRSGVVMEFLGGEKLAFFDAEDEDGGERLTGAELFTPALLKQIGKSYGFQLLTGSADRWPMPVNVGAGILTAGNSGNILIDPAHRAIHDIDLTAGTPGEGYAESLRESFRGMLQHANGGDLVQNVVDMIRARHNANYTIPEDDRPHIVAGIVEVMDAVDNLNIPDSGLGDNYAARIRSVRDIYTEELNARRLQAQQAAQQQAEQCDCCYITTACIKGQGLPDDCEELVLLRGFRDTYLLKKENGEQLISLYYRYSPQIVAAIRRRNDEDEIWRRLYGIIRSCVEAIKQQHYELTFQTYCKMVVELKDEFLPECAIQLPSY